jgi:hypothetical protein
VDRILHTQKLITRERVGDDFVASGIVTNGHGGNPRRILSRSKPRRSGRPRGKRRNLTRICHIERPVRH